MKDKLDNLKLAGEVLLWWSDHEYDVISDGEDESNVYDREPEMVTLAKQIVAKARKDIDIDMDDISHCDSCFCMTHTIKGKCGKCKGVKK